METVRPSRIISPASSVPRAMMILSIVISLLEATKEGDTIN